VHLVSAPEIGIPQGGVELNPGDELSEDAVQLAVADRIASLKKPRVAEFVDALPRTDTGEVDRSTVNASFSKT